MADTPEIYLAAPRILGFSTDSFQATDKQSVTHFYVCISQKTASINFHEYFRKGFDK